MSTDIKHCATCHFHTHWHNCIHLCRLPPECAPPCADEDTYDSREREERQSTYVGTDCDVMRSMHAACGPHGNLWSARDGR